MKKIKHVFYFLVISLLVCGCGRYHFGDTKYPNIDQIIIGQGDMIVLDIRHDLGRRLQLTNNFNHIDVYLDCAFYRSTKNFQYESCGKKEKGKDQRGRVVFPVRTFPGNHLVDLRYIPAFGHIGSKVLLRDIPVDKHKMTYILCNFSKGDPFKFEVSEAYIIDARDQRKIPINVKWEING